MIATRKVGYGPPVFRRLDGDSEASANPTSTYLLQCGIWPNVPISEYLFHNVPTNGSMYSMYSSRKWRPKVQCRQRFELFFTMSLVCLKYCILCDNYNS